MFQPETVMTAAMEYPRYVCKKMLNILSHIAKLTKLACRSEKFQCEELISFNQRKLPYISQVSEINITLQRQEVAFCSVIDIEGALDNTSYESIEMAALLTNV